MHPLIKGLLWLGGTLLAVAVEHDRQKKLAARQSARLDGLFEVMDTSDDPKEWIEYLLPDMDKVTYTGRQWYAGMVRINGRTCDMIRPTENVLFVREHETNMFGRISWDRINELSVRL